MSTSILGKRKVEEPPNESMRSEPINIKTKKVLINLTSECKYFYKKDSPSEINEVVFKVETYGLTNKMDYTGNEFNTKKNIRGSYKLYGSKLNMTPEEIQKIRQQFKLQANFDNWTKKMIDDFYYPLRCIQGWWNETFRYTNGILRPIGIEDIIIPDDEIEKFENGNYDSNNFNFYVNINGVSDVEQTIIPVTIQIQVINNTGGLNESGMVTGGTKRRNFSKRRKLTKRRKILKKRKISKRRRTKKY